MAKHILIGGGTGFIGSNLTKLLTSKGYNVTVISRMPGLKRITWHELESNGIPEKTYAVVNLAGQNVSKLNKKPVDIQCIKSKLSSDSVFDVIILGNFISMVDLWNLVVGLFVLLFRRTKNVTFSHQIESPVLLLFVPISCVTFRSVFFPVRYFLHEMKIKC